MDSFGEHLKALRVVPCCQYPKCADVVYKWFDVFMKKMGDRNSFTDTFSVTTLPCAGLRWIVSLFQPICPTATELTLDSTVGQNYLLQIQYCILHTSFREFVGG